MQYNLLSREFRYSFALFFFFKFFFLKMFNMVVYLELSLQLLFYNKYIFF